MQLCKQQTLAGVPTTFHCTFLIMSLYSGQNRNTEQYDLVEHVYVVFGMKYVGTYVCRHVYVGIICLLYVNMCVN